LKRIILKHGEEERILLGHPWVYGNEIDCVLEGKEAAQLVPGECADVESSRKKYLGRAIVNPNSKITARLYSPSKEGIDKGFFKRRIREAVVRRLFFRDLSRESARLVFAEADFLPGLIIDCFSGWSLADIETAVTQRPLTFELVQAALGPPRFWLSVQLLVWGMDCRREMIIEALQEVITNIKTSDTDNTDAAVYPAAFIPDGSLAGIIEKSAAHVRELEGLPLREGILQGTFPEGGIVIFEGNLPFIVDLPQGQKTGFFLDQRDNHLFAGKYAAILQKEKGTELRILDACSYTGGFGLHTLCSPGRLTMLDVSASALETARKNAALHGVTDRVTTIEANVFDELRNLVKRKEQFDMVILDPPAFAKSRGSLEEALRGYKEINLRAIRLVRPGGIFITCSCSQAVDEILFKRMIAEAAADAERRLVQIDFCFQAQDHPVLTGYDESLYLKCGFFRLTTKTH
jgi:23S rRNA (cytosine1962-C5)-methyltransferase